MKRKIIALLFLLVGCTFLNAAPYSEKIKELLVRLDSLIAQKNTFVMLKEAKIAQLHKLQKDVRTLEERYWLNKNLYDEYCVYNADSAMNYVAGNLDIVYKQNDKYRQMEWKIKKSFLLAATGLLKEAQDELRGVSGGSLPKELLVDYYGQMLYLYSHFNQYTGSEMATLHEHYAQLERVYKDSLNMVLTSEHPLFLWYKGQVVQGTDSMYVFKERLQNDQAGGPLSFQYKPPEHDHFPRFSDGGPVHVAHYPWAGDYQLFLSSGMHDAGNGVLQSLPPVCRFDESRRQMDLSPFCAVLRHQRRGVGVGRLYGLGHRVHWSGLHPVPLCRQIYRCLCQLQIYEMRTGDL